LLSNIHLDFAQLHLLSALAFDASNPRNRFQSSMTHHQSIPWSLAAWLLASAGWAFCQIPPESIQIKLNENSLETDVITASSIEPAKELSLPPETLSEIAAPKIVYLQAPVASAPNSKQPSAGGVVLQSGAGQLKVSGAVSLLGVYGSDRSFVPWSPLFMLPPAILDGNTSTFEAHARQSNLQFLYAGPDVAGWQTGAFGKFYFTNSSLTSDIYGFMPVVAFGEIRNEHFRFAAGLQPDLFAPRDPIVIPMTLMGGTGNAGTFRGQLRGEAFWKPNDAFQATLQTALSDPISTVLIDSSRRTTESDGIPNFEVRGVLGFGEIEELAGGRKERPLELAVAGLVGRIRNSQIIYSLEDIDPNIPIRSIMDIGGMSVDSKINLTDRLGIIGEGYFGQGLGNYAGTIFQTFNSQTFEAIRGQGGFLEAFFYLTNRLHLHMGYGIDAALRRDLPASAGAIARNSAYYGCLFWDITPALQYGVQVDYRETDFAVLNDNSGWIVYNQFALRF
jgi:hypothetical protein